VSTARHVSARIVTTVVLVGLGILVMNLPSLLRRQRLPAMGLSVPTTFTDSARVPAGTPLPDSAVILAALGRVLDPEIRISIVDLGLVHALHINSSGNVSVTIALTTPECPFGRQLGEQAVKEVLAVAGVRKVEIRMDPSIPWNPGCLSPEAREQYRKMFGKSVPITPPSSLLPPHSSLLL
jgi:metal-sulfur cluster biosynthetic enzyme